MTQPLFKQAKKGTGDACGHQHSFSPHARSCSKNYSSTAFTFSLFSFRRLNVRTPHVNVNRPPVSTLPSPLRGPFLSPVFKYSRRDATRLLFTRLQTTHMQQQASRARKLTWRSSDDDTAKKTPRPWVLRTSCIALAFGWGARQQTKERALSQPCFVLDSPTSAVVQQNSQ